MRNYTTLYFADRKGAEKRLEQLREIVTHYSIASVADYYELMHLSCDYTASKYGWDKRMLNDATVVCCCDGAWYIDLPCPVHLDDLTSPISNNSASDILNITVNTTELKDPDAAIAGIFKMIPYIKNRVVNISIFKGE